MPIKARFFDPQPPVKVVDDGGFVYIFICLNEEQKTEKYDEETTSYLEYDYNEFREEKSQIDLEDVMKNPEKYLVYSAKQDKQDIVTRLEALKKRVLQER